MKHILVAGNGFVGQAICREFQNLGWRVSALSRSGGNDIQADISDLGSLERVADSLGPVDVVVHCASAGGSGNYQSVYHEGAKNLIAAFPEALCYFTSSTSVYPQVDGSVVDETSSTKQEREGGQILVAAENVILESGGIVLRLAGLYGAGRSYLLRKFLSGEATMEEGGERILNHSHHDDVAAAVAFLCEESPGLRSEVFNVCDSFPLTQRETYAALATVFAMPIPASVTRNLNSKRGWTHKAVSNAKLRDLGWEPKHPRFVDSAESVAESLGLL